MLALWSTSNRTQFGGWSSCVVIFICKCLCCLNLLGELKYEISWMDIKEELAFPSGVSRAVQLTVLV